MRGLTERCFTRSARRTLRDHRVSGASSIVAAGEFLTARLPRVAPASPGVRIALGLFRRCLGLHRSMLQAGVERGVADSVVQDLVWRLVIPLVRVSYATTRVMAADPTRRAALANDMAWAIVFRAPFRHQRRPDRGPVAFDVGVCPFADYFTSAAEQQFTAVVACSLDARLAEVWRRELARPITLADGGDHCEFTFTPVELTSR